MSIPTSSPPLAAGSLIVGTGNAMIVNLILLLISISFSYYVDSELNSLADYYDERGLL